MRFRLFWPFGSMRNRSSRPPLARAAVDDEVAEIGAPVHRRDARVAGDELAFDGRARGRPGTGASPSAPVSRPSPSVSARTRRTAARRRSGAERRLQRGRSGAGRVAEGEARDAGAGRPPRRRARGRRPAARRGALLVNTIVGRRRAAARSSVASANGLSYVRAAAGERAPPRRARTRNAHVRARAWRSRAGYAPRRDSVKRMV